MRYFKLIILLSISKFTFAQNLHYFNLGQVIPSVKNNCLIIKGNSKALKKIPVNLNSPESITAIKLIGFNEHNYSLDSLMKNLKSLTNLNYIIFENSDLSSLDASFSNFKNLEKIAILKQSTFYENTLFPLLKDNKLKELCIQTNDPEIITDSIHLLPYIKSIQIGSTPLFNKANYTTSIQIKNQDALQSIEMIYFGDFYKSNSTGVRTSRSLTKAQSQSTSIGYQSKLDCINQPIPGIKINDTTFSFNPSQKANFTYESGTKLTVDRNSFLTQNGSPYTGIVTLFYREFRNPVEIMLSGIPMTNKVNGETQLFKSGGMYELNAFDAENKPLTLNSDTAIKINFALTDTSQSFQFFSLNNDGSWATLANTINTVSASSSASSSSNGTRAVKEYFSYIRSSSKSVTDTTRFNNRFYSKEYLYTYRKDNFEINKYKKNNDTNYVKEYSYKKKTLKAKALFRVKYSRLTKDKQIIFTIVPAKGHIFIPSYVHAIIGKNYLYTGNLTKDEFKKVFNRKLLCWDVRTTYDNDVINLEIKTEKEFQVLSAQIITVSNDKSIEVQKKSAKYLNQKVARFIKRDARKFDKITRFQYSNFNDINYKGKNNKNKDELAYVYCKKWQNKTEKPMDFKAWKLYVKIYASQYSDRYSLETTNDLGMALLKSGLGAKNIDCYLHNGTMQDILVRYNNIPFDSLRSEYNTVLFKNINTNYLLSSSSNNALNGYQYKNGPNYIIRFSNNNTMQVTKPSAILENKKSNMITLDYTNQFNVKGLNSDEITKLILD
jgi:hypothetical protein